MDSQWVDALQEGSDHSEEHIKCVAPWENNQQHIQMIADYADAIEQTGIVDLDNDIVHENDRPSFSLIIPFSPGLRFRLFFVK